MPAGDNPHSISEKKATLRESPKQPKSAVNEQQRASLFSKDNAAAIVGIKRPQSNGPLSPTNHHMVGNSGANGHLVYVRRRLETDQNKGGTSSSVRSVNSVSLRKAIAGGSQSQVPSQNNIRNTQLAPRPAPPAAVTASPALPLIGLLARHSFRQQSPGKVAVHPTNDEITSLPPLHVGSSPVLQSSAAAYLASNNVSATSTASPHAISATTLELNRADPPRSSNKDCSDRFIRLQAFLRNNEQSGQEEYIRMLRSLSPVGRTNHARQLEKRAANLLVQEGKELQKMKVLNVLGRLMPEFDAVQYSLEISISHWMSDSRLTEYFKKRCTVQS
ncbi:hypothetical protein PR202_ga16537 [Eleusine coracana subsp. coracana]|uniref:Uncharacterized protein n=1 Tax=Eleusine coracana subsp. coracana TaxID=191504 RepID=A0AAV5CNI7_ELECO|nr:hypothetical protein PR202_ga16537 [Eleusine coracana subsp. coracana]